MADPRCEGAKMPNKGVMTVAYKWDVPLDEDYYFTSHAETIERV
jgi:hypothetical protein